jgi:hypothetical protein
MNQSPEARDRRRKLSQTPEHQAHLKKLHQSPAHLARLKSPEHRARVSKATKAYWAKSRKDRGLPPKD